MMAWWTEKNPSGRTVTPVPLKRPPVAMDGAVGAELGKVLDIELPHVIVRLRGSKPAMFWFPQLKALGWTMGLPKPRGTEAQFDELDEGGHDVGAAAKSFSAFMDRGPRHRAYTINFPYRSNRNWYSIDHAVAIGYWSDKFRRSVEYTHKLGKGVRLYLYGSTRRGGPSFWLLRGGRLRITSRGIEG